MLVEERPSGRRQVTVHPYPGSYVARREWETAYPVELIRRIVEVKAPRSECDEISRDEDPNYVELFVEGGSIFRTWR